MTAHLPRSPQQTFNDFSDHVLVVVVRGDELAVVQLCHTRPRSMSDVGAGEVMNTSLTSTSSPGLPRELGFAGPHRGNRQFVVS